MNDERWEDLVDKIDSKFGIESYTREDLYRVLDSGEKKKHGYKHTMIFNGLQGKMKLERISKPLIIDKKVFYSGRKSDSRVDYIYSDKEFTHKVIAYMWSGKEWEERDFRMP
ncbi:MAG TPA: hypothetical protein PL110_16470 [Candidatus Eremiobacteraeota bacterium]|nr:MAG: hypothetical protein BWY64_01044 [bacterium ADurb.Bin363]HPZ09697.1 hypothetical protein [Candidatus Eremiobacteraeota bacterium]